MTTPTRTEWDGSTIPPEQWARDHYSTIAYAFTRAGRTLDLRKVRTSGDKYPTRLKGEVDLFGHTELDCLDDAEKAGILSSSCGTGLYPQPVFTNEGLILGQWLCAKIDAGGFSTAKLTWEQAVRESGCGLEVAA